MAEAAKSLKVFVSYSRTDVDFADQLVLALEDKGFQAILDLHDISGGEDWRERLGKLILSADAVVFVLTDKSAVSDVCLWEVTEAKRLGKRIIPVTPEPIDGMPLPAALSDINWIRFHKQKGVERSGFYFGVIATERALRVDLEWFRSQTRYSERAAEWSVSRREDRLLRGDALNEAQAWLARTPTDAHPPDLVREYLAASGDAEERREAAAKADLEEREKALKTAEAAVAEKQAAVAEKAKSDRRLRVVAVTALAAGVVLVASALWGLWYAGSKSAEAGERRAELFAQTSVQLLREGDQPLAMLMAVAGDPGAREGLFPGLFRPNGYVALKAALARAYSSDRLLYSTDAGSPLTAMTALPDGKRFVTFHEDMVGRIWDAERDKPISTFKLPEIVREAIALPDAIDGEVAQPEGDSILLLWDHGFGGSGPAAKRAPSLWNLKTNSELQSFADDAFASAINMDPAGKHVIVGHENGAIGLWTIGKTARDQKYEAQDGAFVTAVALSTGAGYFAAGSEDGVVTMGDVETGKLTHKPTDSAGVLSLVYSPRNDAVVSGTATGLFGVHLLDSPDLLNTAPGFAGKLGDEPIGVAKVIISPDERLILLLSTEGEAKLLRLSNAAALEQLNGRRDIMDAEFLPKANTLATGSAEGVVQVWILARPELVIANSDDSGVTWLAANDAIYLRTKAGERTVQRFGDDKPLHTLKDDPAVAAISPDGSVLATWSEAGLCIFPIGKERSCRPIAPPGESHRVNDIVFEPMGKKLAVLRQDEDLVEIWGLDGDKPLASIPGKHLSGRFVLGVDGQYLLDYTLYESARLIRVSDGVEQAVADDQDVTAAAFSPDGVHYAIGLDQGGVQIWRVGDDKPTQVFKGHTKSVRSLTFDKAGELLLSGGEDGAARLWRADEQESLEHFETIEDTVRMVSFDSDGEHVLLLDESGISRWTISPAVRGGADKQVDLACKRLEQLGVIAFTADDRLRFPILKGVKDSPCEELGLIKPRPKPAPAAPPAAAPAAAKPEAAVPAVPPGG
jgi:WD40 repeat protein